VTADDVSRIANMQMLARLRKWVVEHEEFTDVAELFPPEAEDDAKEKAARSKNGYVYLIQWGEVFKIGRGQDLEKRVKQVRTRLSDSGNCSCHPHR